MADVHTFCANFGGSLYYPWEHPEQSTMRNNNNKSRPRYWEVGYLYRYFYGFLIYPSKINIRLDDIIH